MRELGQETMSGCTGKRPARRKGVKLCMLVSESNSCKAAYRFVKAFLLPGLDELHLVTAITTEASREAAQLRQRELLEPELAGCARFHVILKEDDYTLHETLGRFINSAVRPHLIFMGSTNLCTAAPLSAPSSRPSARPGGSFASFSSAFGAPTWSRPATSAGRPATTGGAVSRPLGLSQSFDAGVPGVGLGALGAPSTALKLLPELRCAPVLLAKHNSKGSWLNSSAGGGTTGAAAGAAAGVAGTSSGNAATSAGSGSGNGSSGSGNAVSSGAAALTRALSRAMSRSASSVRAAFAASADVAAASASAAGSANPPMRVMVDLQANSRHVLDWVFEHFTPGRDHLLLTVSQAYDDQHRVKPTAQRLLTAFGVQAAVNSFEAEKATLAGPMNKSLPLAVADSEPDVLVVQAPRCKGVPPQLVELFYCARTSFLIWPPDYETRLQRA